MAVSAGYDLHRQTYGLNVMMMVMTNFNQDFGIQFLVSRLLDDHLNQSVSFLPGMKHILTFMMVNLQIASPPAIGHKSLYAPQIGIFLGLHIISLKQLQSDFFTFMKMAVVGIRFQPQFFFPNHGSLRDLFNYDAVVHQFQFTDTSLDDLAFPKYILHKQGVFFTGNNPVHLFHQEFFLPVAQQVDIGFTHNHLPPLQVKTGYA